MKALILSDTKGRVVVKEKHLRPGGLPLSELQRRADRIAMKLRSESQSMVPKVYLAEIIEER